MSDRRRFSRTSSQHHLIYSDEDGVRRESGQLVDISLGGLCLEGVGSVRVGARCHVDIRLVGIEPEVRIPFNGEVTRADGVKVGVKLDRCSPRVLEHLRRLVMAQSEDPEKALEELREHLPELVVIRV